MKINDVVYLVYTNTDSCFAFQVQLVTEFKKTTKRIYGPAGAEVCRAKFLKRYQLETGWQTPEDISPGQRSFTGIFTTKRDYLYENWEDAKNVLRKNLDKHLKNMRCGLATTVRRAQEAQQTVFNLTKKIDDTQAIDLDDHFDDENTLVKPAIDPYISPFTGNSL